MTTDDNNRVMPFHIWCEMAGVSPATGRRILSSGQGPAVVQLSPRRIGITKGAHAAWLESRRKPEITTA
jgi:hypothetical protein